MLSIGYKNLSPISSLTITKFDTLIFTTEINIIVRL